MSQLVSWVTLNKYAEITGDSADAVHARRKAGQWLDGNECKIVDGTLWVNLLAAERWIFLWGARQSNAVTPAPSDNGQTMIDTELIERLTAAISQHIKPPLPVSIALWDTRDIAGYLKRSADWVRSDVVCLPTFPRPIRLPVEGRSKTQALYKAREVIAWTESFSRS